MPKSFPLTSPCTLCRGAEDADRTQTGVSAVRAHAGLRVWRHLQNLARPGHSFPRAVCGLLRFECEMPQGLTSLTPRPQEHCPGMEGTGTRGPWAQRRGFRVTDRRQFWFSAPHLLYVSRRVRAPTATPHSWPQLCLLHYGGTVRLQTEVQMPLQARGPHTGSQETQGWYFCMVCPGYPTSKCLL